MAEQQLVEYIKKAKSAGQTDDQTKTLLRQNGWTDQEINDAFSTVGQPSPVTARPAEPRAEFRPEGSGFSKLEHQVSGKPFINAKPEPVQQNPSVSAEKPIDYKPKQEEQKNMSGKNNLISKILVIAVLLVIIGFGLYVVLLQGAFFQSAIDNTISFFSFSSKSPENNIQNTASEPEPQNQDNSETPSLFTLSTKEIASVSEEYDFKKITPYTLNLSGDKIVYCAPLKTNPYRISCFLNGDKFLDNPYSNKPYWVGISPDDQKIVFLYYDSAKKQSFTFENGVEGQRVDGAINYPKFSRNGSSFAYVVIGNDGKEYVVANEKSFSPHDKILTAPEWSGDGRYMLYGAMDGEKIFLVADEINLSE